MFFPPTFLQHWYSQESAEKRQKCKVRSEGENLTVSS